MKLSEYPVGTIIDIANDGRYEKSSDTTWYATSYHCVDCNDDYIPNEVIDLKQDQVKIIAMPFSVVWQLAILLQDEYGYVDAEGEDITLEGLVASAVGEVARQKSFEASVERHEAKKVTD